MIRGYQAIKSVASSLRRNEGIFDSERRPTNCRRWILIALVVLSLSGMAVELIVRDEKTGSGTLKKGIEFITWLFGFSSVDDDGSTGLFDASQPADGESSPDSNGSNSTQINTLYLSKCVALISVVCIELPIVPGCHGCETYVARLAVELSHAPKNNPVADQICKVVYSSKVCVLSEDIPVCPICEALGNYTSGGEGSANATATDTTATNQTTTER
ncbi:hypothetical protein BWQ96_08251 [Gracilariopsis chorda]|uniref:Uncharacterized protein n=1 Tax=Gracilariopsis chorda TaxID=448386 RepID=A0A2V3IJ33_9FLOR|nr:hypothetical protein BWQ96_08251 [Gracilariopsis chorda]|eukprot:PXF42043.1 hypothetical protein BWQ96_08251 [Gracilariopsis chorda]